MDGEFNGNKARKLEYFLHVGLGGIKRVVSYGSSQSNAMYSLSVFAKMKGLEFHYVVSNLNSNLASNPIGNFKFALENGMKIYIDKDRRARARALAYELAGLKEGEIYGDEAVNLRDYRSENGSNLKNVGGLNLSKFESKLKNKRKFKFDEILRELNLVNLQRRESRRKIWRESFYSSYLKKISSPPFARFRIPSPRLNVISVPISSFASLTPLAVTAFLRLIL